jgi:hypothetical protein
MKTRTAERTDDLRAQYDFATMTGGVRGKYAKQYRETTNLILLAPDVAEVFHDNTSVNAALRSLIGIARTRVPRRRPKSDKSLQATR